MKKINQKPAIAKTIKLFIGGKFPRSESGRSFSVPYSKSTEHYAHLCLASRKDIRDTVEVAHSALSDWGSRSAFNRSQILYRMAEMFEGKREEFVETMTDTFEISKDKAEVEVNKAIEMIIYFAGFCDKFGQIASTLNPINGPFGNYTSTEPVGIVAHFSKDELDLSTLLARICGVIAGGNTIITIINSKNECPSIIAPLTEVFATSDLPGGVINILTADMNELLEPIASHMDIRSVILDHTNPQMTSKVRELSVGNLKRVIQSKKDYRNIDTILDTIEYKTIWQPVGF